jgi:hypothetical protein
MKLNKEDRREEVAAYTTMFFLATVCIVLIGLLISKLW